MFPQTIKPAKAFFLSCLFAVFLFLAYIWISVVITIGLVNLAQYFDGAIGNYMLDKGAGRLLRRVLMILAGIILLSALKKAGWRGWRDCGWGAEETQGPGRRRIHFWQGALIGLLTLGSLAIVTIATGQHRWIACDANVLRTAGIIVSILAAGLAVAIIEETACRGILFRVFARAWNTWPAALFTSILFACAHFIGEGEMVTGGDSFYAVSFKSSIAALGSIVPSSGEVIRFINLVLLGITLCCFVARTGTIWMSVGAHAAWVAIIKLHSQLTEFNGAAHFSAWLGKRNDFMDSFAAMAIFAGLILITLRRGRETGKPARINGKTWHVLPSPAGVLDAFLNKGENFFSDGKTLKSYRGCRVVANGGLVFKEYWPKSWVDRLKFALRRRRSRRSFIQAAELIAIGVPTPPVLAWSTSRRFGFLASEALVAVEIENAEQLTEWLKRNTADRDERAKVMAAYGGLTATFHRNRYSNRDFKHENVMCSRDQPWRLWAIDLDGVTKRFLITRRRAGKDLMRVGRSLASLGWNGKFDLAAFFEAYNSLIPPRLRRDSFPP